MSLGPDHPLTAGATSGSALVRAYRGERPARRPVWFMRQAGRSLPEYRELRADTDMLQVCLTPELASEITLQPVRRHGVDAAIFFSDIVVPIRLAGVDVAIVPGRGPVLAEPISSRAQIESLPELDEQTLTPIREAVGRIVAELGPTPLIGFAGAPYTLAAYLVEGGPSKDQLRARALMHAEPAAWDALLSWCARVTSSFLVAQVEAGASAAQLFDSWVGSLPVRDYRERVAPFSARVLAAVRPLGAPTVHFGLAGRDLLPQLGSIGADAVGVDWRVPLAEAAHLLGGDTPLQGNIDPALLAAPWPVLERHVAAVLAGGDAAPAHVVNLGHGVPPDTDPAVLTRIVEYVHAHA